MRPAFAQYAISEVRLLDENKYNIFWGHSGTIDFASMYAMHNSFAPIFPPKYSNDSKVSRLFCTKKENKKKTEK